MTYETWLPVPAYPGYEVSDQGQIRSLARRNLQGAMRRERILRQDKTKHGYNLVRLARDGVKTAYTVHSLVLTAFVGPRPEGLQTRHLNSKRDDNRLVNLKWGTIEENRADQKAHGTGIQGKRNPKAKLIKKDIKRIFDLRDDGLRQQAIADRIGISQTWVGKILSGKHYLQASSIT